MTGTGTAGAESRGQIQGWGATKELHLVLREQPTLDVSVVIVSWNTRDLVLHCLSSLDRAIEKSGLAAEAVVVDNGSVDGTPGAVREQFPHVTLLAQSENLGFAAANNLGIEQSTGQAVLILNPDTELHPDALVRLWRTLHAGEHIGMVAPLLHNPDGSVQSAGYRFPGLVQTLLDIYPLHPRLIESRINGRFDSGDGLSPYQIDHPLGACMLVRREVIERVGAFDPDYFIYSEEIDWCRRIRAADWTILCAPSAWVIHYGGQSTGQAPDRMKRQLHKSRARYLRRYHPERFHRTLNRLMSAGVTLKRLGVPIPTGGRTVDELREITSFYQASDSEAEHE